jgi:kinesin family protein C1
MNGTPSAPDGSSALERFKMRRQLEQQQNDDKTVSFSFSLGGSQSLNDSFENTAPSRMNSRARRMSLMPLSHDRKPFLPTLASYQRPEGYASGSVTTKKNSRLSIADVMTGTQHSLSQLTAEESSGAAVWSQVHDPDERNGDDAVEEAVLRSQIHEMKQRIEQLEKEKLDLTCLNAPLQARFREKEDAWLKEQSRLIQENDHLKGVASEVSEKYRDLQIHYDKAEEEVRRLKLDVRKASSTVNQASGGQLFTSSDAWARQRQYEHEIADLEKKLKATAFDLESERLDKVSVEKELHAVKMEMNSMERDLAELQTEYDEISKTTSENRDAEIQLQVLTTEHIATSAQLNAVMTELAATNARAKATIEAKDAEHKKLLNNLQFELSVLKSRAKSCDKKLADGDVVDEAVLQARIEERDKRIAELEAEVLRGEQIRRQMHNRIQELRGNIRVYVRTRPFLPNDKQSSDSAVEVSPDGESLTILDSRTNGSHKFKFDKVFPPSSGQEGIFAEVSDFVQSALDGYQVCLFSYGQTGSGKTHTMQGSGNGAMRGIIPRAVEQILQQAKAMKKQRWEFTLSASFLEIYNEELKDLLSGNLQKKLAIKRDAEGKSYVDGLVEKLIETREMEEGMSQLEALMKVATQARSVASTLMNSHSSRSHSIFKLYIRGYNHDNHVEVKGALNLCDLAGSERLDRSGASNDAKRLKETQAINKSLSALGNVFSALARGASHVPFRDCKLTHVLQDCLSGDGKALMFVNLSPTSASSSESLNSLRFAQNVNQVELGKPKQEIKYKH